MKNIGKCPENELSGFTPSEETVNSWKKLLSDNGISEGCLFRAVGGIKEEQVVEFKDAQYNDIGVFVKGAYALTTHKGDLKVATPLFKENPTELNPVSVYGVLTPEGDKSIVSFSDHTKTSSISYDGTSTLVHTFPSLEGFQMYIKKSTILEFETERDLFTWMAL